MSNIRMRALTVDDHPEICHEISRLLEENFPEIEMASMAHSVEEGLEKCKLIRPELLFLDMDLGPRKGLELLGEIDKRPPYLIFVSAFGDKYGVAGFKAGALDFIQKPIEKKDFVNAVRRAVEKKTEDEQLRIFRTILNNPQTIQKLDRITIPGVEENVFVDPSDVILCEAAGNYTHLYLSDRERKLTASKNLSHFETILKDDPRFIRTNRSFIVNINRIQRYNKQTKTLILEKDLTAKVSNSNLPELKRKMGWD